MRTREIDLASEIELQAKHLSALPPTIGLNRQQQRRTDGRPICVCYQIE